MARKASSTEGVFAILNALASGASAGLERAETGRQTGVAETNVDRQIALREDENERLREQMDFTRKDRERMLEKQELDEQLQILGPFLDEIGEVGTSNTAAQESFQGDIGSIAKTMVGRIGVDGSAGGRVTSKSTPAAQAAQGGTIYRPDWQKIIQSADDVTSAEEQITKMEAIYKSRGLPYIDPFGNLQNDPKAEDQIGPPVGLTIDPATGLERNLLPQDGGLADQLTELGQGEGGPMTMEQVLRDVPKLMKMLKPEKKKRPKVRPLTETEISSLSQEETRAISDLVKQISAGGLDPYKDVNWRAMQREMGGKFRVSKVRRAVISRLTRRE